MDYSALTICRLFRGLSVEEIETSISDIPCYVRHYEEGEMVYRLMSRADRIGIILSGRVEAEKIIRDGNQFIFSARRAGEILGPTASFSDTGKYPFGVRALEKTAILTFSRIDFLRMLQRDIRLIENFTAEFATANFMLQQRLELLTYKGIQQKIAFYLMTASKDSGGTTVPIPGSIVRWALMMNVSRPSLHRELKKMEERGLIRYALPVVEILDSDGLRKVLER